MMGMQKIIYHENRGKQKKDLGHEKKQQLKTVC